MSPPQLAISNLTLSAPCAKTSRACVTYKAHDFSLSSSSIRIPALLAMLVKVGKPFYKTFSVMRPSPFFRMCFRKQSLATCPDLRFDLVPRPALGARAVQDLALRSFISHRLEGNVANTSGPIEPQFRVNGRIRRSLATALSAWLQALAAEALNRSSSAANAAFLTPRAIAMLAFLPVRFEHTAHISFSGPMTIGTFY